MTTKIRLSESEVDVILDTIRKLDQGAEIYLYGSRIKPEAKGGDIDLLVLSHSLNFSDKVSILATIKEKIGDQKIDLTIMAPAELKSNQFFLNLKKHRLS